MSKATEHPRNSWRKRLMRWSLVSLLMGASFTLGVAVTAIIAARLLLPIAATGIGLGVVGMAQAGSAATINALHSGDSETRMSILSQLKQSLDTQPPQTFDENAKNWIMPALEQCRNDIDPEVVRLAEELIGYIEANVEPKPQ